MRDKLYGEACRFRPPKPRGQKRPCVVCHKTLPRISLRRKAENWENFKSWREGRRPLNTRGRVGKEFELPPARPAAKALSPPSRTREFTLPHPPPIPIFSLLDPRSVWRACASALPKSETSLSRDAYLFIELQGPTRQRLARGGGSVNASGARERGEVGRAPNRG